MKNGLLAAGAAVTGSTLALPQRGFAQIAQAGGTGKLPTKFIHACMTLPNGQFPMARALVGIKKAGYSHVAWGTRHRDADGQTRDVMAVAAFT